MTVFSKLAIAAVAISGASALKLRGARKAMNPMPDLPAGTVEVPGDGLNVPPEYEAPNYNVPVACATAIQTSALAPTCKTVPVVANCLEGDQTSCDVLDEGVPQDVMEACFMDPKIVHECGGGDDPMTDGMDEMDSDYNDTPYDAMGLASGSDIPPMDAPSYGSAYGSDIPPMGSEDATYGSEADLSSGSEGGSGSEAGSAAPYYSSAYGYMPPGPGNMDGDMYPDYMDSNPYVPDTAATYPSGPYSAPYYPAAGYPGAGYQGYPAAGYPGAGYQGYPAAGYPATGGNMDGDAYPDYADPMPAYPNDPVDGGAAPITAPVMPGSDGDLDNDGAADVIDPAPTTPAGVVAPVAPAAPAAPVVSDGDMDNDAVPDTIDTAPTVPGTAMPPPVAEGEAAAPVTPVAPVAPAAPVAPVAAGPAPAFVQISKARAMRKLGAKVPVTVAAGPAAAPPVVPPPMPTPTAPVAGAPVAAPMPPMVQDEVSGAPAPLTDVDADAIPDHQDPVMGVSPAGDADADGVADAADPNDMGEGAEESTVSTQTGATIDEGEAMPAAPVAGADADPAAPGHQTVADMPGYHADPYMQGGYAGYPYGAGYPGAYGGYPGAGGAYGGYPYGAGYPGYGPQEQYNNYPHAQNDVDADGVYDPADPVYGASPPNDYDADGLNDHHDPDDMGPGPEDSFHVPADCEAAIEASPSCSVNPVVRGCLDGNMELCWQIEHHIPASVLEDCKGEAIASSCDAPSGAMEDVDADVEESGAYGPVATDNAVDDVPNDADYTSPVTTAAGTVTAPAFLSLRRK